MIEDYHLDTMVYFTVGTKDKFPPMEEFIPELEDFLRTQEIDFKPHGLFQFPVVNRKDVLFIKLFYPLLTSD